MIDVTEILDHYDIYYEESFSSLDYLILCPFHDDKNLGSAKMDKDSGLFNCYSCGARGNIYQFVAMLEEVTPKEAGVLIENDFELEKTYDIGKLKDKVTKIKIIDRDREYRSLARKVSYRILFNISSSRNLDIFFIHRWLLICTAVTEPAAEDKDIDIQYKQLLNLYSIFTNERSQYD